MINLLIKSLSTFFNRLMAKKNEYKDFTFIKCDAFDEKNPTERKNFGFKQALKDVSIKQLPQ